MASNLEGPVTVKGSLSVTGTFYPPAESISDAAFSSAPSKRLSAEKAVHQIVIDRPLYAPGTNIAAITQLCHIVYGTAATIESIEAVVTTAATGDRTATIDLQKSTAGGAFATVLSGVLTIDSSSVVRVPVSGAISSAGLVAGDVLQLVVAVAGASGTQPAGLLVTVVLREDPE